MRKVELIYLHALLAHAHEYLEEQHHVQKTFEAYEAIEVRPYQIQRRKAEHEAATRLLAARLAEEVTEAEVEAGPELPEARGRPPGRLRPITTKF